MPDPSLPAGVRIGTHDGMPAIVVETPLARAAISLHGAQVLSFVPAGHDDLLWVSPATARPPKPIRGGIPVCWPWFARQGMPDDAPQHGVARTAEWRIDRCEAHADGTIALDLVPAAVIHPLGVRQHIRVGRTLEQSLATTNTTDTPFALTQAFHTYFRVGDATRVGIEGIAGLDYLDKPSGFARRTQQTAFAFDGAECDRIYLDAGGHFVLDDPVLSRRIRITAQGSRALVVWNAGAEKIRGFADIPADGWRTYFCLEVANAGTDVVTLAPGATHVIGQALAVEARPPGG